MLLKYPSCLFLIQINVLHWCLINQFDSGHGLPLAQTCTAGLNDDDVRKPLFGNLVEEGRHHLPGSGRNPAGTHMDIDLGPVFAFSERHLGLHFFLDLFEIFYFEPLHHLLPPAA